ncbi:MAG: glycosyltransferase family 9 protein, partial [Muribaculaceae bacterium]|nr:glycosyltransferase family 9 protein [Muribaculaceae bacterium]
RRHNKVLLPLVSSRARYRQAFHAIGLPAENTFEGLYGAGGCLAPAEAFASVTPDKAPGEKWIGIAPFAQHKGKIYPPELMEEVMKELASDPAHRIFLFGGGAAEQPVLAGWARKYPRVTSLADKRHGFAVELPLMSRLDVMISMDSANMHLASLVATPVVSVWGATHPYCGFKGWRQSEADIVQLPMTCRPCSVFGNKPCFRGDWQCLRGIPPQLIADRVRAHLR